jgi:hypothetical protein
MRDLQQRGRQTRADREPHAERGAGLHLRAGDDGAGADQQVRPLLLELGDGVERRRRAQRHLDRRQAALRQRIGQRHRIVDVVDRHHRQGTDAVQQGKDRRWSAHDTSRSN